MSDLVQDLRLSFRLLLKHPGFTLTAILVLALGIAANAAVFTLVNTLMFKPLAGRERPGEVVGIYSHDHTRPNSYRGFSFPSYTDVRDNATSFSQVTAFTLAFVGLGEGDTTRRSFAAVVARNYFQTLGVDLLAGRTFSEDEERPGSQAAVAVVSYPYFKSHGGDRSLLGKSVKVNSRPFTIVGVAPRGFTGTSALVAPDVWVPIGANGLVENDFMRDGADASSLADRRNQSLMLVGRLKPGLTPEAAAPSLKALSARLEQAYPAENKNQLLTSQALARVSISTSPQNDNLGSAFGMLMGMAIIVLVVASLNLANMMLARGTVRRKEIAMRLALGGGRGRIIRQLLTEGLMLSLIGGAIGLLLGYWGVNVLVATLLPLSPVPLEINVAPDLRVLGATLVFCVLSTVVFGLGPAWKLARTSVVPELKEQVGEDRRTGVRWLPSGRNLLVATQIALSLGLLTTAGLFTRGAMKAGEADPGYSYAGQVVASVDTGLAGYDEVQGRQVYRRVLDRLRGIPGVKAASFSSIVAFGGMSEGKTVQKAGTPPGRGKDGRQPGVSSVLYIVGADYFATLGLKVRGREFTVAEEQDSGGPAVAIIDEPLARELFGHENPIGQQIQFPARDDSIPTDRNGIQVDDTKTERQVMEVVGVAPGLRHDLFDKAPVPHVYVPFGRQFRSGMNLHAALVSATPAAEAAALQAIRREIKTADDRLPVLGLQTMAHFRDTSVFFWIVKAGAGLFATFGVVAVFLAVVGLYAVKAYVVARRTREIGIRMALGSSPGNVLWLVLKEGLLLTTVGLAIGFAIAAGIGKLVGSMLYEVGSFDPIVFSAAPLLLAVASLAACYLPALRATRIQPTVALRTE